MTVKGRILLAAALVLAGSTLASAQPAQPYDNGYGNNGQPGDQRYDPRGGDSRFGDDDRRDGDRRDGDRRDGDRRGGRPVAIVYADDKFSGRQLVVDRPIARLGDFHMDDKISSIDIRGGSWLVCSDDDFRGRCITLDHSVRKLDKLGMEDKISSIRPVRSGN